MRRVRKGGAASKEHLRGGGMECTGQRGEKRRCEEKGYFARRKVRLARFNSEKGEENLLGAEKKRWAAARGGGKNSRQGAVLLTPKRGKREAARKGSESSNSGREKKRWLIFKGEKKKRAPWSGGGKEREFCRRKGEPTIIFVRERAPLTAGGKKESFTQ